MRGLEADGVRPLKSPVSPTRQTHTAAFGSKWGARRQSAPAQGSTGGVGSAPPFRFRTIQLCPKDLRAALRQVDHAANRAAIACRLVSSVA
jgi:hypothetical protein